VKIKEQHVSAYSFQARDNFHTTHISKKKKEGSRFREDVEKEKKITKWKRTRSPKHIS
jgi:hypothetical protein